MAVCLEKLMAMNTTRTELRLAIIIAMDKTLSSAKRVYFDGAVN